MKHISNRGLVFFADLSEFLPTGYLTTLTFSTSTQKINMESWTILVSKAAIFIQTLSEL